MVARTQFFAYEPKQMFQVVWALWQAPRGLASVVCPSIELQIDSG